MNQKIRVVLIAVGLMTSLGLVVAVIAWMSRSGIITPAMALLLLVALLGFYIGFGVLILTYRLICKLR